MPVSFLELFAIPRSIMRIILFMFWVPPGPIRFPLTLAPPPRILELPPAYHPVLLLDAPVAPASTNSTYEFSYANWTSLYVEAVCNSRPYYMEADSEEEFFWLFMVTFIPVLFAFSAFMLLVHRLVLAKIDRVAKAAGFTFDSSKAEIDAALFRDVVAYSVGDIIIDEAQFENASDLVLNTSDKAVSSDNIEESDVQTDGDTSLSTVRPEDSLESSLSENDPEFSSPTTPVLRSRRNSSSSNAAVDIEKEDAHDLSSSEPSAASSPRLAVEIPESMPSPNATSDGSLSECSETELEELDLASMELPTASWSSTTASEETPLSAVYLGESVSMIPDSESTVEPATEVESAGSEDTQVPTVSTEGESLESDDLPAATDGAAVIDEVIAEIEDSVADELADVTLVEDDSPESVLPDPGHDASSVELLEDPPEELTSPRPVTPSDVVEPQHSPAEPVNEPSLLAANVPEPLETAVSSGTTEENENNEHEESGSLSPSSEATAESTSFIMVDDSEPQSAGDDRQDSDVPSDSAEPAADMSDAPNLESTPEVSDEADTTVFDDDLSVSVNDDATTGELLETAEEATTAPESPEDLRAESPASEVGEHGEIPFIPGSPTHSAEDVVEEDIRAAINDELDVSPLELAIESPSISLVDVASPEEVTSPVDFTAQSSVTDSVGSTEDASETVLEAPSSPVGSEKAAEESEPIVSPVSAADVSPTVSALELPSEVVVDTETPEASPLEPDASTVAETVSATPESVPVESLSVPSSPFEEESVHSEPTSDVDGQESSSSVLDTPSNTLPDDTLPANNESDALDVVAEPAEVSVTLGNDSASDDTAPNNSSAASPVSGEDVVLEDIAPTDSAFATAIESFEEIMDAATETPDVLPATHAIDAVEAEELTVEIAAVPETSVSEPLENAMTPAEITLEGPVEQEELVHAVDEAPQDSVSDALKNGSQPTSPISSPDELPSPSSEIAKEESVTLMDETPVEPAAASEEIVDELLEDDPQSPEALLDKSMDEEPVLAVQETSEDSVSDNSRSASPISSPAELASASSEIVGNKPDTFVDEASVETAAALDETAGEPLENAAEPIESPADESTEKEESVPVVDEASQDEFNAPSGSQPASPISSPAEIASPSSEVVDEESGTLAGDSLESEVPTVTEAALTPTVEVSSTPASDDTAEAEALTSEEARESEEPLTSEETEGSEELIAPTVAAQDDVLPPLPDDEFDEFSDDLDSHLAASVMSESLLDSVFLAESEQTQTAEPATNPFADPALDDENASDGAAVEAKDDTPGTPVADEPVATQQPTAAHQDSATGMADSWIVLPPDEQDVEAALAQHVPAALLTSISEDASLEAKEAEKADDADSSQPILDGLAALSPVIAPIAHKEEAVAAVASEDETKDAAQVHVEVSQPLDTESF